MPRTLVASVRRAGAAVAAAVAAFSLLALTACTGGGGATVTPTPDESPTAAVTEAPSASPTPTELTEEDVLAALPEQALTEDFPGASAFAEFFVIESQAILTSKDPALFIKLSDTDCQFCQAALERLALVEDEDLTVTGGQITLDRSNASEGLQEDGTWVVQAPLEITEAVFTSNADKVATTTPAQELLVRLRLEYLADRWKVLEVATVDE